MHGLFPPDKSAAQIRTERSHNLAWSFPPPKPDRRPGPHSVKPFDHQGSPSVISVQSVVKRKDHFDHGYHGYHGSARTLKIKSSATPRRTRKKTAQQTAFRGACTVLAAPLSNVESPHDLFRRRVVALAPVWCWKCHRFGRDRRSDLRTRLATRPILSARAKVQLPPRRFVQPWNADNPKCSGLKSRSPTDPQAPRSCSGFSFFVLTKDV
jgi:hypothetical protein